MDNLEFVLMILNWIKKPGVTCHMVHGAEAHPELADLVRAVLLAPDPGTLDPAPVLCGERGVVVDVEGGTLHPLKPFFPLNFGQQRSSSVAPLVQNETDFRSFGILTVLDQFLEDKHTYSVLLRLSPL